MSNPIYQAAIAELEQVLPPRVVSRALKEGMVQQNQTPDTIGVDDFDAILKGSVYRQLQVSMPPEKAKQTVAEIMERLQAVASGGEAALDVGEATETEAEQPEEGAEAPAGVASTDMLRRQEEELVGLRAALKPFNLYFEWPEVQKLRAQIQLLEEEHRNQRDASGLIEEAHHQLSTVRQKLEDQLVIQAREMAELEEAFEQVQSIGGVKVRRLENLVGHIREAQSGRQLAPAELERARKIAKDLRKLVESSVYQEQVAAEEASGETTPETVELSAEVTQRLQQLDRESEQHDVQRLEEDYANLLDHLPELVERLDGLRAELEQGRRIDTRLAELRDTLAEAAKRHRTALREEFSQIEGQARSMPPQVDTNELLRAVTVANGVLETTLPSIEDTQYVRRLHRLALEKREEIERVEAEAEAEREVGIGDQRALQERSAQALERYQGTSADAEALEALAAAVKALSEANDAGRLAPDLAQAVRRAEARLEAAVAEHADDARVRERAQVRALLSKVDSLPGLDALSARISGVKRELMRLLEEDRETGTDRVQLEAIGSLVAALRRDAIDTCRTRLDQLAERASESDAEELLGRIQSANNVLDDDVYPDIRQLEAALRQQREAYRQEQFAELRRLQRDASEYIETGLEEAARLEGFLARVREQLEHGGVASDLHHGRELLDQVQATVERRLADFGPRLDAALEAFSEVAMLNSEDVATVRRILKHLDSQRDAFPRVSTGLRIQLERSLEEAETLLAKLQEEVDATRAIADRLMSGNVLDDVLGLFGGPDTAAPTPSRESVSTGDPVADWLDSFASETGVLAAAILGPNGWVAGELNAELDSVREQIGSLQQNLTRLGDELRQGPLQIATIELDRSISVLAWVDPIHTLVLSLDTPTVLSLIGHRLRTELDDLQEHLGGSR